MLCRFIIAVFFIIISLAGPQDGPVGTLLAMEQPMVDQPGLTPYTPT
jgi:hypothetical protein